MMDVKVAEFRLKLGNMNHDEVVCKAISLFVENETLNTRLKETENASTEMSLQYQQMKDELSCAKTELKTLREQIQHLTGVTTMQSDELYGRSTEKAEDILGHAADGNAVSEDPLSEDAEEQTEDEQDSGKTSSGHAGNPSWGKTKGKKARDLSKLPSCSVFDYDINELNEKYGEGNWRFAFWRDEVTLELVRQTTYVKHTFKPVISVGLEHALVRVGTENAFMPKSLASESLIAQLILDKYSMFLPLYRQEHDSGRFGFPLSRQTMSNWIGTVCHDYFMPVYEYMCSVLKEYQYQQCDETTYKVIHDGRAAGSTSFIWVHRSSELMDGPAIIVYCYEKTRGADHLRNFYSGLAHKIFLTCDAYIAYASFAAGTDGLVILCGCFMHARRRFVDALRLVPTKGMSVEQIKALPEAQAVRLIGEIYHEENKLKDLDPAHRSEERKTAVKEKVDAYFDFIHSFEENDPSLSEKMRDALQYSINQETCLRRFLEDGNIPPDDGATERSVKPIAQGRRNYLFSNTIRGAESTVIASTIIETAKANGADPYYYLKYLLEKMPSHLYDKDKSYLPEMMSWSDAYKQYEEKEKQAAIGHEAPPGSEKPRTPRKKKTEDKVA